jgi:hypothetical protein
MYVQIGGRCGAYWTGIKFWSLFVLHKDRYFILKLFRQSMVLIQ